MTISLEEAKDRFFHEMFHRNCEERETYNQPLLSYREYVANNRQFLENQWANMEFL